MTDGRHIVSYIGRLCFSFALVLLIKGGLNYQYDCGTITTECKIVKHRVKPSLCLYKWQSCSGIMTVCHFVQHPIKTDNKTDKGNETRCRDRLMSPCYSSHADAWEDLATTSLGMIYPCYYHPDDVGIAFDERYQWEMLCRVGGFLLFVSVMCLILFVTSKSYAKLE